MKRAFVSLLLMASLAGCKQGVGERCQVDADCEDGLVCVKAKNTCETNEGGAQDALVIDSMPTDAAVDAMPDATIGSGSGSGL